MNIDADVLVIGAGIAGLSAAYFAAKTGRAVTIVDDGRHRASNLPVALINPLRGHTGRLVARGIEGMNATFALIDALRRDGHAIDAGRGLYRPLIDLHGETATRSYWEARLGSQLAFDWHPRAPRSLGLIDAVPALFLREPGWVASATLLDALTTASRSTRIEGRVVEIAAGSSSRACVATLADGTKLRARTALWCAGAWGAAGLDDTMRTRGAVLEGTTDALYKPGSLLATSDALTDVALSFGLYAVPWSAGARHATSADATVIGPTREGSQPTFPDTPVPLAAIAHMQDRVARVFGSTMTLGPVWRGVRLARMSGDASAALRGIATLTALGSRGFLMAPLLAAEWARSL